MTLRPLIPLAWLLVVLVPLLALTVTLAVRHRGAAHTAARRQSRSWWLRSAMLLVLLALGLGPSIPRTSPDTTATAVDVFFVVDRTGSMAAEDYNGEEQRLAGVKADILGIVEDLPGARYSILTFDSSATRQLPLTTDVRAVRSWVDTYNREVTGNSRGSLIDRPLEALTTALTASATDHPDSVRLVFFLSDGENTAKGERKSFEELAQYVDGGAVLGYGTPEGGRMRTFTYDGDGDPEESDYIPDYASGKETDALSKIDEEELRSVASELGIDYAHRTAPTPIGDAVADVDAEQIAIEGGRAITSYQPVLWPFALALSVLLGLEIWGMGRRIGRKVGRHDV